MISLNSTIAPALLVASGTTVFRWSISVRGEMSAALIAPRSGVRRFDRFMRVVCRCLVAAVVIGLAWVGIMVVQSKQPTSPRDAC